MRWFDGVLFAVLARASVPRVAELKPQELANTAWAFVAVRLGHVWPFIGLGMPSAASMSLFQAFSRGASVRFSKSVVVSGAGL